MESPVAYVILIVALIVLRIVLYVVIRFLVNVRVEKALIKERCYYGKLRKALLSLKFGSFPCYLLRDQTKAFVSF